MLTSIRKVKVIKWEFLICLSPVFVLYFYRKHFGLTSNCRRKWFCHSSHFQRGTFLNFECSFFFCSKFYRFSFLYQFWLFYVRCDDFRTFCNSKMSCHGPQRQHCFMPYNHPCFIVRAVTSEGQKSPFPVKACMNSVKTVLYIVLLFKAVINSTFKFI